MLVASVPLSVQAMEDSSKRAGQVRIENSAAEGAEDMISANLPISTISCRGKNVRVFNSDAPYIGPSQEERNVFGRQFAAALGRGELLFSLEPDSDFLVAPAL